jgi:hypothetical protein
MESRRIAVSVVLLLMPLVTGVLLNFYLFNNQFRGGFPLSWFFRYSTGLGHNDIILFTDWTALMFDLLIFFVAGIFCFLVYAFARMRRESSVVAPTA